LIFKKLIKTLKSAFENNPDLPAKSEFMLSIHEFTGPHVLLQNDA